MEYKTTMAIAKDRFVTPAVSMVPRFGIGRHLSPFESMGIMIPELDNDSAVTIEVAPRAHEFNYPSTHPKHGSRRNVILEFQMDDVDGSTITDDVVSVALAEQGDPTFAVSAAVAGLGKGVTFDGTDDAFDLLTTSMPGSSLITTGDFSVEVVFKTSNATSGVDDTIVCCRDGDSTATHIGWQMLFDAADHVDFHIDDGTTLVSLTGTTDVDTGVLVHLIASLDRDGNGVLYVNGVAEGTASIAAVTGTLLNHSVNTRFAVGGDAAQTATSCYTGDINFVRVYDKALSATEAVESYRTLMGMGHPGWIPLADPADGDDLIVCKSASDPIFFDLTEYMTLVPVALRARCATEQTTTPAALDFVWVAG